MDRVGPGLAWHRGGTFTSQCTRADVAQHALDMFVENHLTCNTITEHRCAVAGEVVPTGSHSRKKNVYVVQPFELDPLGSTHRP